MIGEIWLSKISRDVPKAIASFGEKQFKETGASLVEVLRVKEATLRKYFRQLRGILYVVAVVSRDRVRAYFFNAAGVMVIGENLEEEQYNEIRKSARIMAKFEKPRPLTPEELRIEATQDLRDALGKAIRRVSRALTLKEPPFPDIFVTRQEGEKEHQGFGIHITEDNEILFEESILAKSWSEGLLLRTGFLMLFDQSRWKSEFVAVVGNGIALSLLKDQARRAWYSEWKKRSKDGIWESVVNHFTNHASTYNHKGYHWIALLLNDLPLDSTFGDWKKAMRVTHDALSLPMGTEEYHIISGFCKSLKNPQQLVKRRHLLDAIHMAPRALCDPTPLGIHLSVAHEDTNNQNAWAKVRYASGVVAKTFQIVESDDLQIRSMEYWLNLEDTFPITGGPISQGRSVVARSLAKLGLPKPPQGTFEATLELKERPSLDSKDIAILERLVLGDAKILSNSLVGSPQSIRNLLEKGVVALVPNFNHLGITADYLIHGLVDHVRRLAHSVPEGMIFNTSTESYGVLSAPANWSHALIEDANEAGVGLWPIISVESGRQILREEVLFPASERTYQWSESPT
jgi:hypothetical protein